MQNLVIKQLDGYSNSTEMDEVSVMLNGLEKHELDYTPWPAFPYKPSVLFAIAYSPTAILLKFFVQEKQIRAINYTINSSIWEDSCVEFFISFDEGGHYYNMEFNCIGTGLIGYGASKANRELLDVGLVNEVKTLSIIHTEKGKKVCWELTMVIPIRVFENSQLLNFSKKVCKANFYKCGDLLPDPHFVSWSNIQSDSPNFHLPDYFGDIQFE